MVKHARFLLCLLTLIDFSVKVSFSYRHTHMCVISHFPKEIHSECAKACVCVCVEQVSLELFSPLVSATCSLQASNMANIETNSSASSVCMSSITRS